MIQAIATVAVIVNLTGCATPYMIDRRRDAADILTVTIGVGYGAKARLGPVQTGLLADMDLLGLRGGYAGNDWTGCVWSGAKDFQLLIVGGESLPLMSPDCHSRGKDYTTKPVFPFVQVVDRQKTPIAAPYYYSQIEVVAACIGGIRVGFNPGELLDFLLGWATVDIFNDDLEAKKQKDKSNQVPEDTARKLADPQH